MLIPILYLAKWFFREPCSIQREIINRSSEKRGAWDASNDELVDIYDHLDAIVKKLTRQGTITPGQFFTLIKHPTSALNFIQGRKVPFNDLEKFKSQVKEK
ncbi:hypothetical protein N9X04_00685 [bacterium]|nr:hypothetical protein [bacterium]